MIIIKFGFIGAGKVGFSLGKYLKENNIDISGYYSKSQHSSKEAAIFTNTRQYNNLEDLIKNSDTIFITTPDSEISVVWSEIKKLSIKDKLICHCSGSISSEIFSNINNHGAYGYSIHPMFAISDKYNSYKNLSQAFITIEGHKKHIEFFKQLFSQLGNDVAIISKENIEECLKKMKFQDVHIDQNIQQRTIIQDLTFDGCLFENIDFTKVSLKHLDLIDVTFDKCDLSNQNFDHQYLNRVQFKNCKLTGTSFIETNLKDVLFDHCQGRYSNLSSSQLFNVMFDHCDLQEASFYDANFKKIQFNETNLIQSELASLHHKGLDLSTCQIQGATFLCYISK